MSQDDALSPVKRALLALKESRAQVQALERARQAPIAIVGMACRLPGEAGAVTDSPAAYWDLLTRGADATGPVPPERWASWGGDDLLDRDPAAPGKTYVARGGFLADVKGFDPEFFGISRRETQALDPQQRLSLEVAWEALEQAGMAPDALQGQAGGVFLGICVSDYLRLAAADTHGIDAYLATGNTDSCVSGRIAYTLGLTGPAISVDTACSSSLTAVYSAVRALRAGDCSFALAGGVNLILGPEFFINFCRARMLSPEGRCKAFDAAADGFARGEGCGMVVLKRLDDALAAGDNVLAVIRAAVLNQDGRTSGLTVPSGPAQQALHRAALAEARLAPDAVDYIEAHGTGTSLGDPIEVGALAEVYGARQHTLRLGSVKTNLGHLESAAGIAGLIKTVLCLQHEALVPNLHFQTPNPHIDWERLPFEVVTTNRPWPRGERPRIAGVSSFGFSGTNAHVLLEEAPIAALVDDAGAAADNEAVQPQAQLLAISAKTPQALQDLAQRHADALEGVPASALAAVAYTAGAGRGHFAHRLALVGNSAADWQRQLRGPVQTGSAAAHHPAVATSAPPRIAFVFSGQGSQSVGMGLELYRSEPVFRQALDDIAAGFAPHLHHPLLAVMGYAGVDHPGVALLDQTGYTQPALFALHLALARLWQSWGIAPDYVLGHSIGEFAAAHLAGVFTLQEAIGLVAERARLMQALPAGGAMAAVFSPLEPVQRLLQDFPGLSLAAANAPAQQAVAGPEEEVAAFIEAAHALGLRSKRLRVSHPFHCAWVEPMLPGLAQACQAIGFKAPSGPRLLSNVSGQVAAAEVANADYWVQHARQPVRFARQIQTLLGLGVEAIVEIGPRPSFAAGIEQVIEQQAAAHGAPRILASLDGAQPARQAMLATLGALYTVGAIPRWQAVTGTTRKVSLPTYPFQREPYWVATAARKLAATAPPSGDASGARLLAFDWIEAKPAAPDSARTDSSNAVIWQAPPSAEGEPSLRLERLAAACMDAIAAFRAVPDDGRFWIATRHGVSVRPGERPDPAQAAFWGLGRVLALENPARWGGLIDLPAGDDTAADTHLQPSLAAPLASHGCEDQLAWRRAADGSWLGYRARLRPLPPSDSHPQAGDAHAHNLQTWQADAAGAYLITGGTGALGRHFAAWLAGRGARRLVLVSRRGADDETLAGLQGKLPGVELLCPAADMSSAEGIATALRAMDQRGWTLAGIALLAGTAQRGDLDALRADDFVQAGSAKVSGPELLREALHARGLHTIPLFAFSSVAAAWGSKGQAPYAVANAYLDAFTAAWDGPAVSLAWGPWAGGGMADADALRWLAQAGLQPLAPQEALQAIDAALAAGHRHLAIARADLPRLGEMLCLHGARAFLEPLALANALLKNGSPAAGLQATAVTGPTAPAAVATWLAALQTRTPAEAERLLVERIGQEAGAVLGRPAGQPLAADARFFDHGMDSLMAVELRNRLRTHLGLPLPSTVVFDHGTVALLARHLHDRLHEGRAPASPAVSNPATSQATPAVRFDAPIAIVGMGCRLPGGIGSPQDFWTLLQAGQDAVGPLPPARWAAWGGEALYDPDPETPGKLYTRDGGYLSEVAGFDAAFFGLHPREAESVDPQHRLLLEVAWEALEQAGIAPDTLGDRAHPAGIFVGITASDYARLRTERGSAEGGLDPYFVTGTPLNAAAGRIAYTLGLTGPAVAIDTACSSSLTALHQACQALRTQDCDLALAGGVNLILAPDNSVAISRARMLSPDGRCKTFDAAADGFVRGEGCGIVVLKRLDDALAAGDNVLAVVRASGINQDGAGGGFTVPSGPAQQALLARTLARAGLDADAVDYIEAHGTGTSLGDPIEVGALAAAYGTRPHTLHLGSVKTNLGHLESAAGIAGLIKTVLCLQHEALVPNLHFQSPNPHIDWERLPFEVVTANRPWPRGERPRIAGVSAFGFSGTNAHVLLEEAPAAAAQQAGHGDAAQLLVLSAKTAQALKDLAASHAQALVQRPALDTATVAHTAGAGRAHFTHRLALVGASTADWQRQLGDWIATGAADGKQCIHAVRPDDAPPRIAFVFSGQGSQSVGMGLELYRSEPVFRQALDDIAAGFAPHLDHPLLAVMGYAGVDHPGVALLDQTGYTQPALFALHLALARLWQSWGIAPDYVLGHSIGEFAAAHLAGVFTLQEAIGLVAERARLMQALPAGGAMAAVFSPLEPVQRLLQDFPGLSLAAANAPAQQAVAGPEDQVAAFIEAAHALGLRSKRLRVSHPFHCAWVEPMLAGLAQACRAIEFKAPSGPRLLSNVSGQVAAAEVANADYWVQHARQPVRFARQIETLLGLGVEAIVEIGPRPAFAAGIEQVIEQQAAALSAPRILASLDGEQPARQAMLATLGALYTAGATPRWQAVTGTTRKASLPTYPFQRQTHWLPAVENKPISGSAPTGSVASTRVSVTSASAPTQAVKQPAMLAFDWLSEPWTVPAEPVPVAPEPAVRFWHAPGLSGDAQAVLAGIAEASMACIEAFRATPAGVRFWMVTRRGVAVRAGERPDPVQAAFWGLGRSLALEDAGRWGGLIDLPDDEGGARTTHREAPPCTGQHSLLLALTASAPDEDQLALRRSTETAGAWLRWRTRLSPVAAPSAHDRIELDRGANLQTWQADPAGAYLLTGGSGALGRHFAGWLARRGARQLVIASRRGADAQTLAELRQRLPGVELLCLAADMGTSEGVESVLQAVSERGWRLAGAALIAGVVQRHALQDLHATDFMQAGAAKIGGALALQQALRARGLHTTALFAFSSVAAAWGSKGQAPYAVANAYLDGLAAAWEGPSLAIAWGPWGGGGMADAQALHWLAQAGLHPLEPGQALSALDTALRTGRRHVAIANADLARLAEVLCLAGQRRFLDGLPAHAAAGVPAADAAATPLIASLQALHPSHRLDRLQEEIETLAASLLKLPASELRERGQGFFELGFDSFLSIELRNALARCTGLKLPATLAFEHPNPRALALHLLERLRLAPSTALMQATTKASAPAPSDATAANPSAPADDAAAEALVNATLAQLFGTADPTP
jgi:acyl transferase domain-containing protein/short-subunit dehydrogenase/acyl carrier protein